METYLVAATAIAVAIGTAIKQITDNRELKKWICFRNPCPNRDKGEPDDVESKSTAFNP